MTEQPKSVPPEQVFGIAKKAHLELEKLNMVDHAAVINMLNTMAQHREMSAKFERQQAEEKARQDAMEQAQAAHARAQAEQERRLAEQTMNQAGLEVVRDGKQHGSLILVP